MTFAKVFYKNLAKKISLDEKDITFESLCLQLAKAFNIINLQQMRIIYINPEGFEVIIANTNDLKTAMTSIEQKETLKLTLEYDGDEGLSSTGHQNPQEKNVNIQFKELESMPDEIFSVSEMRCEYLDNPLGIDTPNPRFTWSMQDTRLNATQAAYRILVGTDQQSVQSGAGNMWDTNWVNSDARLVTYSGKALQPFTQYFWRVDIADKDYQKSNDPTKIKTFETGMMDMKNWQGKWITDIEDISIRPAGYFRTAFQTSKPIKSARAYVSAGGLFDLSVNGQNVTDQLLNPMYTRFDLRNLYVTLDVTSQVQNGQNAIGVILGNGWYNFQPVAVWGPEQAKWRKRPRFCLNLRLTFQDGTSQVISTNTTDWKATFDGPIISNNIFTGEHYDMTKEMPGWDIAQFDDSGWKAPIEGVAPSNNIVSQVLQPIRHVEQVPAKTINKFSDTNYIFDLGRNIAGVTKFTVKGDRGTTVKLIHSELVDSQGHANLSNINNFYHPVDNSDPFQTDIYILSGNNDTFMPRFNYKGFRYIEVVSDKPITLTVDCLTAYFMHSDVPAVGQIQTSNPTINPFPAAHPRDGTG